MNEDRDLNRLLDTWFAEGPIQAADRVVDGTASRIAHQRQLPAWRLRSWRFPSMSTPIKLVAVGAALLAVLVGGAVLMGGGSAPPPPTPSPTASPTPTASPSPSPMPLHDGALEPGTYIAVPPPGETLTWTVTVPAGWSGYENWGLLGPEVPGEGMAMWMEWDITVPEDSCAPAASPPAESVADFVAALEARDDWVVSDPVPTSIGGFSGSRVDIELPADVDICDGGNYYIFTGTEGAGSYAQGPSNLVSLWVLDVDGRVTIILRSAFAEVPAEHIAQSDQIVETSEITP